MSNSHKIKDFTIGGTYDDDAKILKVKEKFEMLLEEQMRSKGSVPVLNISPKWFTSWDVKREVYHFELIMYGVYVGKRKQEHIVGWDSLLNKMFTESNLDEANE